MKRKEVYNNIYLAIIIIMSSFINGKSDVTVSIRRSSSYLNGFNNISPVRSYHESNSSPDHAILELLDGSVFQGFSFGAPGKSVAGECVFQTGARTL